MTAPNDADRTPGSAEMHEVPVLFVCHGDDGGPRIHPCRRVQDALRANKIEYRKVIGGRGSPWPWLRKAPHDELRAATGESKLPALKLPDGTIITHSRAILKWIRDYQARRGPRASAGTIAPWPSTTSAQDGSRSTSSIGSSQRSRAWA